MSQSPHCQHLRNGVKMGSVELVDTMIKDGLWDAFNGYHMGTTAENVAKKWQITRQQQDEFAVKSQNKAEAATKAGKFKDEIAPVTIKSRKGDTVVDTYEYPKAGVTLDSIANLRAAFDKEGTVTAANASGINDAAAALVLMKASEAAKLGKTPLEELSARAAVGLEWVRQNLNIAKVNVVRALALQNLIEQEPSAVEVPRTHGIEIKGE
jgi:acetyl-CoA C-acetyltransferase